MVKKWTVKVGKKDVQVVDSKGVADAIEICTRALEYLSDNKVDYSVGPLLEARCDGVSEFKRTDVVLANAGRYYEAAEMQRLVKQVNDSKG